MSLGSPGSAGSPGVDGAAPAGAPAAARDPGLLARLGSLFRTYAIPQHSVVVPRPFAPDDRRCFTFPVPAEWPCDERARSELVLLEDGLPLGPAHTGHDDIRSLGAGRYSHWGPKVYFSASDGSDPNANGRVYSLVPPPAFARDARRRMAALPRELSAAAARRVAAPREGEPAPGSRLSVEWSVTPVDPAALTHVESHAWALPLEPGWASDADSFSTLMLLEDGRPLPHPHAPHHEIAELGAGRYSHWGDELRFSSSDGSDPSDGSHRYSVAHADAFLLSHATREPEPEQGACWVLRGLPAQWPSDLEAASSVALLEDGRLLGPAHSPHDVIREQGAGAYCHWGRELWFSTSDGSDPRRNGRTYTVLLREACGSADD